MKANFTTLFQSLLLLSAFSLMAVSVHAGDKTLTDKSGMTLYTFDKDNKNQSVCYDGCAAKWPPYLAAEGAKAKKQWGLITRKDGSKQWTYKGQPLYTWVGDSQKGDTKGDGIGGVWHVAKKSKYGYKSSKGYGSSYSSVDY